MSHLPSSWLRGGIKWHCRVIYSFTHEFTHPYFFQPVHFVHSFIRHLSIPLSLGGKLLVERNESYSPWLREVGVIKIRIFLKNIWNYLAEIIHILRRRNLNCSLFESSHAKRISSFILWIVHCLGIYCSWEDSGITWWLRTLSSVRPGSWLLALCTFHKSLTSLSFSCISVK